MRPIAGSGRTTRWHNTDIRGFHTRDETVSGAAVHRLESRHFIDFGTVATTQLSEPANRVSPRAIWMWMARNALAVGIVVAITVLISLWLESADHPWLPGFVADRTSWLPWIVAVLGLPEILVEPFWRYAVHRWEVADDVFYTRFGWYKREWRIVPISRVQTVDTNQGPFERALGLATLEIRTASHAGSSAVVGLSYATAQRLANELAQRAAVQADDAT